MSIFFTANDLRFVAPHTTRNIMNNQCVFVKNTVEYFYLRENMILKKIPLKDIFWQSLVGFLVFLSLFETPLSVVLKLPTNKFLLLGDLILSFIFFY